MQATEQPLLKSKKKKKKQKKLTANFCRILVLSFPCKSAKTLASVSYESSSRERGLCQIISKTRSSFTSVCVCVLGRGGNTIGHLTGIRGLPTCFSLSNCLTTLTLFTPLVPPRLEPLEAAVGGLLPVTPNAISANSLIQRVTKSLLVWVFKGIKVL